MKSRRQSCEALQRSRQQASGVIAVRGGTETGLVAVHQPTGEVSIIRHIRARTHAHARTHAFMCYESYYLRCTIVSKVIVLAKVSRCEKVMSEKVDVRR